MGKSNTYVSVCTVLHFCVYVAPGIVMWQRLAFTVREDPMCPSERYLNHISDTWAEPPTKTDQDQVIFYSNDKTRLDFIRLKNKKFTYTIYIKI